MDSNVKYGGFVKYTDWIRDLRVFNLTPTQSNTQIFDNAISYLHSHIHFSDQEEASKY